MMPSLKKIKLIFLLLGIFHGGFVYGLEISFWHSMAGQLGNTLNEIIQEFNKNNPDYTVKSVYKGTYPETLTSTVAAYRARAKPDIVQIFDIATATMINPPGVIMPAHIVFAKAGLELPLEQMIKPAIDYYSDQDNNLLALPFNISTPVLFYNKSLFAKAGLEPNIPPKTWDDVEKISKILLDKGLVKNGFSSAWIGWSLFESFSLIHNLPFATSNNGFESIDVKVTFNNEEINLFIERLQQWQKENIFLYGGRLDDAQAFFTSGKCAMFIQSSGSFADLAPSVSFELGMTRIPFLSKYKESELGNLIGGAAIWVTNGLSSEKLYGIAKFFKFIMSPKIQLKWQNATGYLSVIDRKYLPKYDMITSTEKTLFEAQHFVISRQNKYKGIRLGNYMQIRDLVERQLEAVWAGYMSARDALSLAAEEADRMLVRFKRNTE
ncbi:MAG: extracellular solute-binding protein [Legionellales bacterium]|nr:extracellular solute-binding protein [Legionellales bacterium]